MLLKRLIKIVSNYKQYEVEGNKKISLDLILAEANPQGTLEQRIEWIQKLVKWIRETSLIQNDPATVPHIKLKYLFMVLERNPAINDRISLVLKHTLQELSCIEFFCEVGLPSQIGLLGELGNIILTKILPKKTIGSQLSELMAELFPTEEDALWLRNIDETTLLKITQLFDEGKNNYPHIQNDLEESLIYLTSQIVALGLSPGIRKRIPHKKMKSLPFFSLAGKLSLYLKMKNHQKDPLLTAQILLEFRELLDESLAAIKEVYLHFNRFGVSTHLVFQIEKLKLFINRTYSLIELYDSGHLEKTKITHFISELAEQHIIHRNALGIFSSNATLLSQKIIEANSQTGEHYIAKDSAEYWHMVKIAMGGGVLTALTVFVKNALGQLALNKFFYGLFSTLNYSGSFLLIQFCGFTLATKQPATTASALAQKLETTEGLKGIELLTDEIVLLTRTQFASVVGNLSAVIPTVIIINLLFHWQNGQWLYSLTDANYTLHSTDILGPSLVYAVFTGFLLWLSSIISGWSDNWFTFHQLNTLISQNNKIRTVLGPEGATKLALFFDKNTTGITGSISLGIFLGLVPELLKFIGIPLEVRHVTLSTGALAAALPTLGWETIKSSEFIRAILGIGLIGTLNIGVSFLLALILAFKAKKISTHRKALIFQSVLKRFTQKPFSFFIAKSSK